MSSVPKRLEEDIDKPMINIVKYLNLLRIETLWSCCGFNYEGQPKHKDHIIGCPQIICKPTQTAFELFREMIVDKAMAHWKAYLEHKPEGTVFTLMYPVRGAFWNEPDSPHFHEIFVAGLYNLEQYLLQHRDKFQLHVEVEDTNRKMKEMYENWNYPPTQSWDIVNIPEEENKP